MKKDYDLCMLYQQTGKPIAEVLENAIEHMRRKYKRRPFKIYVNDKVDLKKYDGIRLVHDKQMYTIGLVALSFSI